MKPSIIQTSVGQPSPIGQSYMSSLLTIINLILFLSFAAITHSHAQCEFAVPCPITIEQISDDGICGAFVSFDTPTGSGSCAMSAVIQTDGTGLSTESLFPVGFTTLTYSIEDDMGNMASCDIEIFITDTDSDNDGFPNCEDICPATANNIDSDGDGICDDFDPCFGADNVDSDMDGVCDALDLCEGEDDNLDDDGDNTPNCLDGCPDDPNKTEPGICGCGFDDSSDGDGDGTIDCLDGCPDDPNKTTPGICGCNIPDIDSDGDGFLDCADPCPADPFNTDSDGDGVCDDADLCFGLDNIDDDGDGVCNSLDQCPGEDDRLDTDEDGTPDCQDDCPEDPNKIFPGICGCGEDDNLDSDGDFVVDCIDGCPDDPNKVSPGICGCHVPDIDSDNDGIFDCDDPCDNNLVGLPCDDFNPNTVNDMIQMDCTCAGTPTELNISCPSDIIVTATSSQGAMAEFESATAFSTCNVVCAPSPIAGFSTMAAFRNSRYYLSDAEVQWPDAKVQAEAIGGHLVAINDELENNFISQFATGLAVHIGLTDEGSEGNFYWVNGDPLTYTNWGNDFECVPPNEVPENPDNMNPDGFQGANHVLFRAYYCGEWGDYIFNNKRFVVEIPCENSGPVHIQQTAGQASASLFTEGTHTITFTATDECSNTENCSFDITVLPCEDADGDGVCNSEDICPDGDDNIDFDGDELPDACDDCIVGQACDDNNPATSDDQIQADCTCQGTGGSDLSITCPSDIMMEADAPGGAIVAFPTAMATSSCIILGDGQDCNDITFNPTDFQDLGTFGGSRYLLSTYQKRWSAAQTEALALNGYLVAINDADENAFIANQINEYVHIGYNDAGTEGDFIWTDNSTNSYTNLGAFWNNTSTRDFAVMEWWSGNGTWELVSQWTSKKFVVEIPCDNGGGSGLMVTQSQGQASGGFFPIGIHPITFTATDACGNMESCNFLITVTESTEICDGIDNNNNGMIDENLLDSDGDGVCDDIDICPGFDDLEDKNNNGIPDGCEEPDGASVGDKVFDDLNNNGLQDEGEPGIEEIFVALYQNGIFIDFRYTDNEGIYLFENIAPGDYQIKFANPNEGYEPVAQGVGNNDNIDSDADFFGFTEVFSLAAGESNFNIDAGFHDPTNVTEYCESMGLRPWKQYIRNVTLVSINNTSFKERYGDFTHLSTDLEKKADYTISLQPGFSYTHHNVNFRVWIDYNQNGSFQEANELVFEGIYLASTGTNGQAAIPITGEISIPENILEGSTRMRVAMQKNHFAEPCETFNLGEVEDYTVNILPSNSPLLASQAFNLQGYQNGQHTQLQWGSNTGYKNDHFDIERSADGIDFEYLTTTENVHWTDRLEFFANLDEQPLLGDNFYRIKKVHLDGTHEYSNIIKVNFNIDLTKFLLFPNPAHEQVTIGLLPLQQQAGNIQVYNVYGQLVFEQTWTAFPEQVDIDLSAYLNGVYTVFVQPEKRQRMGRKLVVQRMY